MEDVGGRILRVLYKDNGEIPQRDMAGRQRLNRLSTRRHGVNNIGNLNLIISKKRLALPALR